MCDVLYRYVTCINSDFLLLCDNYEKPEYTYLKLVEYPIIKETEKGYWINIYDVKKRFVHKSKGKYAYDNKEKAMEHFIRRQHGRVNYAVDELQQALHSLNELNKFDEYEQTKLLITCKNIINSIESSMKKG